MSGAMLAAAAASAGLSAALSLVDAQIVSNSSAGNTVIVNKPVGTASGDLLVAVMVSTRVGSWTPPAGFTEVLDVNSDAFGAVAWKTAGGAEGATYTFTADVGTKILVAAVLCFRNAAFDTIGSVGSAAQAPQAGPITLSGEGLTLAVFATTIAGVTFSTPTGCTPVVTDSDSSSPSLAIFRKAAAAGATAVISSVGSPTSGARGLQIGIKKV